MRQVKFPEGILSRSFYLSHDRRVDNFTCLFKLNGYTTLMIYLYCLVIFVISGCSSGMMKVRLEPTTKDGIMPEDIVAELEEKERAINSVVATGSAEFNSRFHQSNFNFSLTFLRNPPLFETIIYDSESNEEIARVFYNSDTLIFLASGEVYAADRGSLEKSIIASAFPLEWLYGALWGWSSLTSDSILSAQMQGETERSLIVEYTNYKKRLLLGWASPGGSSTEDVVVLSQQIFDTAGNLIADFSYDSLKATNGFCFPLIVNATDFTSASWLSIRYERIEINKRVNAPKMPEIPKGKRVRKVYR